ncbi:uncharacterized protein L3040_008507 [Drepanopeziza brunnea f. sp. 'multigermtubi']|uniref:Uncharacterized protein n=1 Tax=Marssonina brunnea f. sp. multigermtubi (strain MB_m1) TaxID=1072389 RepID=K1WVB3_MARBU|nr:uncharacterized protein MBM_05701 [Drepanopeziza brunnea f. sp. 'multigermtubi' MB_m1]EKD16407.1 hypothetical protein MBM_05701 [Drepanopeziza brunnea f. sp. 'multigermtubi' MB_m1]KAJ5033390.1 hypothetical protein L3040_008507 [Drepanopeziza brunnea f. sp. 'multigermtubi']
MAFLPSSEHAAPEHDSKSTKESRHILPRSKSSKAMEKEAEAAKGGMVDHENAARIHEDAAKKHEELRKQEEAKKMEEAKESLKISAAQKAEDARKLKEALKNEANCKAEEAKKKRQESKREAAKKKELSKMEKEVAKREKELVKMEKGAAKREKGALKGKAARKKKESIDDPPVLQPKKSGHFYRTKSYEPAPPPVNLTKSPNFEIDSSQIAGLKIKMKTGADITLVDLPETAERKKSNSKSVEPADPNGCDC